MNKKMNIAIIGYGRFGSLLAKLLAPYGEIFVLEKKDIKISGRRISLNDLGKMDLVIPAVPISKLEKLLRQIEKHLHSGAIVMDVSSVKALPCSWLSHMRDDIQVIGSHPMFGPDSARFGLKGLQVILCPLRISHDNLQMIKDFWADTGVSVMIATPEQHDREAAKSLALVHFLGRGLTRLKVGPQSISTLGFERLLKVNETVENDTRELFQDMHKYNPNASKIRQDFLIALSCIDSKLTPSAGEENIASLRRQVDFIDNQIIVLLEKRLKISTCIGVLKKTSGRKIRDLAREKVIIKRLSAQSALSVSEIQTIYRDIFSLSRKRQK